MEIAPGVYLPDKLIFDLTEELTGLRELMVFPSPGINLSTFEAILARAIECVADELDVEYKICEFCYGAGLQYFPHCNHEQKTKAEKIISDLCRAIQFRLSNQRMYINNVFPYVLISCTDCCFCLLRFDKVTYADVQDERPFRFTI